MPTSRLCRPLAQNGLWRRRSLRRSRHNPIDLTAYGLLLRPSPYEGAARFRSDLALSHRFTSRQQRNRQPLSPVRNVPARSDYADVIAAVSATKARSPTLVGIIWKSA